MNCVAVSGRLGKDPTLQYSNNGNAWGGFSLAIDVSRSRDDKKTVWFDCKTFGRQAEVIAEHFKTGDGIEIVGEFDLEEWSDKNTGEPRKKTSITVRSFSFPPTRRDENGGGQQQRQQSQPRQQGQGQQQRSAPPSRPGGPAPSRPGGAPPARPGQQRQQQHLPEDYDGDEIPL